MKTRDFSIPLTGQLFSLTLRVPRWKAQNSVSWTSRCAGGDGWGKGQKEREAAASSREEEERAGREGLR